MVTHSILISATEESNKVAKVIEELLKFDFVPPVIDLSGTINDFASVALVIVVLTEDYSHKKLLENVIETKIPLIFIRHSESLPGTYYVQQASNHGRQHYFNNHNLMSDTVFNTGRFLTDVHAKVPLKSTCRKDLKKRILLVGASGSGKSTLTSLLINGSVKNGINPGGILVSDIKKASLAAETYSNDEFLVTDTVGLGYPGLSETASAVHDLHKFLSSQRYGYHAILFCISETRIMEGAKAMFELFYKSLFPDMTKHFAVVYTNHEDSMDMLDDHPDPMENGVKGLCTGIDMEYDDYEETAKTTLNILKECILNKQLMYLKKEGTSHFFFDTVIFIYGTHPTPSVPELAWKSNNSFFNAFKGAAQSLSISVMDNDFERMSNQMDRLLSKK